MLPNTRPPEPDDPEVVRLAAAAQEEMVALRLQYAAAQREARQREAARRQSKPTPAEVARQSRAIASCCDTFPRLAAARAAVVAELAAREAWLSAHQGKLVQLMGDWRSALAAAHAAMLPLDTTRRRRGVGEEDERQKQLATAGLDPGVLAPIWPSAGTNLMESEVTLAATLDIQRTALAGDLFLAAVTYRQALAMLVSRHTRPGTWLR